VRSAKRSGIVLLRLVSALDKLHVYGFMSQMEEFSPSVMRSLGTLRHHAPHPTGPEDAHFGAARIGWQALGPTIAITTLATCVVVLRWYTRFRIVRCAGVDDFVIFLSMVSRSAEMDPLLY